MVKVSHSELSAFHACARLWHYSYRLRRGSRLVAEALNVGRRVDLALRGEPVELKPQERAMVGGHRVRWADAKTREVKQGVWFDTDIGDDIRVVGELDAVGVAENGDEIVIERKTTSEDIAPGSNYWRRVTQIDPQVSMYLLARPKAAYVLYDVLRKPALRGKAGETEDELYARCVESIATKPDYYYQRAQIVRFPEEHAAHVRDVKGTVRLMQLTEPLPPRSVGSCFKWGRECDFYSVCTGEREITDDAIFMDRPSRSRDAAAAAAVPLLGPGGGKIDPGGVDAQPDRYRF